MIDRPLDDVPFWNWFAGFFDGEGSVGIYPGTRDAWRCTAKISLRADDGQILQTIRMMSGIGTIYHDTKGAPSTRNPCLAWAVNRRDEAMRLVEIFERYPLRAKKARDVEIWSEAVREWCRQPMRGVKGDWTRIAELADELREQRKYWDGYPKADAA